MSNLTNVDAFSFLQWATIDPSYYDELFYNLGLCKIAELESNGDVVWRSNNVYFFVNYILFIISIIIDQSKST